MTIIPTFVLYATSKAEREVEPDWLKRPKCCDRPKFSMCSDCHATKPPCLKIKAANEDLMDKDEFLGSR